MFKEGYTKAENEIKKGKDPTALFNQCPGADDAWDRGWVQACADKFGVSVESIKK
jgi:hypothetical protein